MMDNLDKNIEYAKKLVEVYKDEFQNLKFELKNNYIRAFNYKNEIVLEAAIYETQSQFDNLKYANIYEELSGFNRMYDFNRKTFSLNDCIKILNKYNKDKEILKVIEYLKSLPIIERK